MRKRILALLLVLSTLLSCAVALPEEDVEPAAVEEPTPVPLGQATVTVVFDLPDTPTPAPTATPTEVAQDSVAPVQVNDFVYLQSGPERQALKSAAVDEFGRAVLEANAIEVGNTYVRSIRPSPKGDLAAVIFGTEVVYIYDFASGELFPLVRDPGSKVSHSGHFLGWSHDSQFILFRPDAAPEAEDGLLLVEIKTGKVQLLSKRNAYGAAISPDGKSIILGHEIWENHGPSVEVWHLNRETNEETFLFKGIGYHSTFTWSPDGNQIAYLGDCSREGAIAVENTKSGRRQHGLCLMNPDGTNRRLVTLNFVRGYGAYPIWSPDSRHIAYERLYGPPPEKPDDGPPLPIGPELGNKMDFVGTTIHVLDTETGAEWPLLTDSREGDIDPAWSPDGSQILFTSKRNGSPEIWRVNLDGTNLEQLTFDGQMKRFPLWSK